MQKKVVIIKSLSPSGHGIADNGWYILGAFPGDNIRARQYKFAEGISYAEILEIITPSPHRIFSPTQTPFFDPNAPWQYFDMDQENIEKLRIVKNIFEEHHIELCHSGLDPESLNTNPSNNMGFRLGGRNDNYVVSGDHLLTEGYRNKAAYAFTADKHGKLSFALFTRGVAQSGKISQTENILVHLMINKIGKQFLEFFNQKKVSITILKYLTLRYSYYTNTLVAQILVTESNRKKLPWKKSDLETFMNQYPTVTGVIVSHSEPGIRSASITKNFYEIGDTNIIEKVLDKEYTYHPSQFFQIYPDAFAQILADCENIIKQIPNHNTYELLDFFAGIGIIGIHLADLVQSVYGVEQSPLAAKYAGINAQNNNVENYSFTEANVDEALEQIRSDQILIVDPARSGLTNKSIEKIIEVQPEYIIYISCNPETQADDYVQLKNHYDITWSRAYNLFPKTPHIEHVIFLKKKGI